MQQAHLFFLGEPGGGFSRILPEGLTTTCMVMTPPGSSPTGTRDSAKVLLFSRIFPALINFMSLIVLGPFAFSLGHCARMLSFKVPTVVVGAYLLGPMSVPSYRRNLSSNSSSPAISENYMSIYSFWVTLQRTASWKQMIKHNSNDRKLSFLTSQWKNMVLETTRNPAPFVALGVHLVYTTISIALAAHRGPARPLYPIAGDPARDARKKRCAANQQN